MLTKLKIHILSWLLYQANQLAYKDEYFYAVKNQLLHKYGKHITYDVQFIAGKECRTCDGTGVYTKFYHGRYNNEPCNNCWNGFYKRNTWNILAKFQFGKYVFHKPFKKVYQQPYINTNIFGYIVHSPKKHTTWAAFLLLLLYEKGFLKRWYKTQGIGWRCKWWHRKAWVNNFIHIIKKGKRAYPFRNLFEEKLEDLPF